MHLGQARRTQRNDLQIDDLRPALAKFLLQQGLHHGEGEGRHPVLQMGQLLHHVGGEHIGAGRQQLAQLDEGGPELQELGREPAGPATLAGGLAFGGASPRVGPGTTIPPEACQQLDNKTPDAQGTPETGQPVPGAGRGRHQACPEDRGGPSGEAAGT